MRAKIFYFRKEYAKGLNIISSILKEDKDHIGGLYWKARIMIVISAESGNNTATIEHEAIRCLQKVLEINSHHIEARNLLALLYEKNDMYKEAIYEYKVALHEEESLLITRINLSILYNKIGLKTKSLDEINRAIKISKTIGIDNKQIVTKWKEIRQ